MEYAASQDVTGGLPGTTWLPRHLRGKESPYIEVHGGFGHQFP